MPISDTELERARLAIAHENEEDRGCVDSPAAVLYAAEVFRDAYDDVRMNQRRRAIAVAWTVFNTYGAPLVGNNKPDIEALVDSVLGQTAEQDYYERLEAAVRNYEKALTAFCQNPTDVGLAQYEAYWKSIKSILAERKHDE